MDSMRMKKSGKRIGALMLALALSGSLGAARAEWKEETKGGKVVRRAWLDASGEAALSPEGYAVVTLSYSGTSVTEKYYDLEGNPARVVGGYYGRILTYGNRHRLEDLVYLDENGKKASCDAGYARMRVVYTSAGGVTTAGYYDEDNNLVMVPSLGYAQVKNDYRGTTLTKTTYMDADKNPVDTPLGYAVLVQTINKSNRITGMRFEHADGSPAVCLEGWATMRREMDSKSREVSLKYYDLAGNLVDRGLGYAYEVKKWESDLIYTVTRYDTQDQQVLFSSGCASLRRQMNKAGQLIRETRLDAEGNPVEDAEGIAARKYEYDNEGRLTKVTFQDAMGVAAETKSGYGGYQEAFDAEGFVSSRTYLNKAGAPVNISAGYSEIRYKYDENHQLIATEYYDVNGSLVKTE